MSTLRVTNIQHPNAEDPAIELSPSGGVLLSGAGDAPSGSTGVPWFLPYPEPGEAWGTQAIQDLAEQIANGLSAASVLKQIVTATDATQRTTTSSTFANAGISADITPTAAGNLIIAFWSRTSQSQRNDNRTRDAQTRIVVDGTPITGQERNTLTYEAGATTNRMIRAAATQVGIYTTVGTTQVTFECQFNAPASGQTVILQNGLATGVLLLMEVAP